MTRLRWRLWSWSFRARDLSWRDHRHKKKEVSNFDAQLAQAKKDAADYAKTVEKKNQEIQKAKGGRGQKAEGGRGSQKERQKQRQRKKVGHVYF